MKRFLPVMSVLGAGTLWGIISLFIRTLSAAGLDAMQITLIRLAVAAPVMLVIALLRPGALRIRLRDLWMFAGTGIVSIVLFNICYFYTMIHSQASVAVVLLYTSPVFVMLLSALLFRERITLRGIAALVMTVIGCTLVAGLSGTGGLTPLTLCTGLASGLFYGLYTIFGRIALRRYSSLTVTVYTFLLGLLGALPVSRPAAMAAILTASPSLLLWCAGIGLVCTVLPYILYTAGLSRLPSGKAAVLAAAEPLVGCLLGIGLYKESCGAGKLVGMLLILSAILLLSLAPARAAKTDAVQEGA
ncbi:MAG: EamA family transporter [Oscillospiraceae bacterium]|nr:EamA family transporter [Oscillospiraceae bacterium]